MPPLLKFAFVLFVSVLGGPCAGAQETNPQAAPELFQRIVVLGASVSSGFDYAHPLGSPATKEYRFAHYLDAALRGTHEPIATQASVFLFMSASETMDKQLAATIKARPSLVIGMDALFWFCYGTMKEDARFSLFEKGLAMMERIEAPLILGDIPDGSRAVGKILSKPEMPELATIARCNERLKTWAAARGNVTLFPLSEIMRHIAVNDALSFSGMKWEQGKSNDLLQGDQLHPRRHGLAALAIGILDVAARSAKPPLDETSIHRDLEAVYEAALAKGKLLSNTTLTTFGIPEANAFLVQSKQHSDEVLATLKREDDTALEALFKKDQELIKQGRQWTSRLKPEEQESYKARLGEISRQHTQDLFKWLANHNKPGEKKSGESGK